MSESRLVIGCMSGTSIDALDAALVDISGEGLAMQASVVRCASRPLGELAPRLRAIAEQEPFRAGEMADAARELGLLHLKLLRRLIGNDRVSFIAVHGQTVFHQPPVSWQLINPAPIAYGLGAPVVYDLRAADLSLGGQGAPITPLADFILFRSESETRTFVNLGGFVNVTRIHKGRDAADVKSWLGLVSGCDVCACNQLLDRLARDLLGVPFDRDGKAAAKGRVVKELQTTLHGLLRAQSVARRSLGTGDVLADWFKEYRHAPKPEDILRTACTAIAATIVTGRKSDRLILAGGGVKNKTLLDEIKARSSAAVSLSDEFGVPAAYREAIAMAVLGALCQDRVPITLSQVTGAVNPPVAGCWVIPIKNYELGIAN